MRYKREPRRDAGSANERDERGKSHSRFFVGQKGRKASSRKAVGNCGGDGILLEHGCVREDEL